MRLKMNIFTHCAFQLSCGPPTCATPKSWKRAKRETNSATESANGAPVKSRVHEKGK